MLKKKFFPKIVCLILIPLALPSYSFACRCAGSISPASAYHRTDVVLRGKVLSVKGDINKEGATARISVLQVWKKSIRNEVNVFTNTTCAFDFRTNEEYLLYLHETPEGKYYTTEKCLGNLPISEAKKTFNWLKRHGTPTDIDK